MRTTNTDDSNGSKGARWLAAGLACLAAVPWLMLAAGAPSSLLLWIPASLVAIGFACAFLAVAVVSIRGRLRSDFLLIGLAALSLVTLLYAPALVEVHSFCYQVHYSC